MIRAGRVVVPAALAALSIAAALLVARTARRPARPGAEFQQLVGGLGLGTAVDLSGPTGVFDARVDGSSRRPHPLPSGVLRGGDGAVGGDD